MSALPGGGSLDGKLVKMPNDVSALAGDARDAIGRHIGLGLAKGYLKGSDLHGTSCYRCACSGDRGKGQRVSTLQKC